MGMMGFDGNWAWWMPFGWLMMVISWLAFLAVAVWVIAWVWHRAAPSGPAAPTPSSSSPLDIAKARYARGEITKEQFEQLKRDLS